MSIGTIGDINDWVTALNAQSASASAAASTDSGSSASTGTSSSASASSTSGATSGSSAIEQAEADASGSTTSQLLSDLYGGSPDTATSSSLANIAAESALWHGLDERA